MLKTLGKETILYGLGNAVNKVIAMLALPILTRLFTPTELGQLDLVASVERFGILLGSFGIDTALTFYYWDTASDSEKRKSYISSTFFLEFIICIAVVFFLLVFEPFVLSKYIRNDVGSLYLLASIYIPFHAIMNLFSKLCRIRRKPILFNILTISTVLLYLTFLVLFGYVFKSGINSVYYSRNSAYVLACLFSILYFKKEIVHKISLPCIKDLLLYGLPLVPFLFGDWLITASARFFLNHYLSTEMVGRYFVAVKIANIVTLVLSAFSMAWGPYAMSIKNSTNAKETYGRAFTIYLSVSIFMLLVLQTLTPTIINILSTNEYIDAGPVYPIIALGLVFHGMYGLVGVGLTVVKKTHLYSIGIYVAAGVSILGNVYLIPKVGIIGAAISNVLGFALSNVFIFFIGNKYYKIQYSSKTPTVILISVAFFVIQYILTNYYHLYFYSVGIVVIYAILMFLLGAINIKFISTILKGRNKIGK